MLRIFLIFFEIVVGPTWKTWARLFFSRTHASISEYNFYVWFREWFSFGVLEIVQSYAILNIFFRLLFTGRRFHDKTSQNLFGFPIDRESGNRIK